MATKTYSNRQNAARAAKKAHPDGGYAVREAPGGGWTFEAVTYADDAAAEAPTAAPEGGAADEPGDSEALARQALADHGGDYAAAIDALKGRWLAADEARDETAADVLLDAQCLLEMEENVARKEPALRAPAAPRPQEPAVDAVDAGALLDRLSESLAPPADDPIAREVARRRAAPTPLADAVAAFLGTCYAGWTDEGIRAEAPDADLFFAARAAAEGLRRIEAGAEVAKSARPKGEPAKVRPSKAPADPTAKPVITSPSNQNVARLCDRIEAARGDLEKLRAFTFKPANTYYATAHRYLQALIAEAEAKGG